MSAAKSIVYVHHGPDRTKAAAALMEAIGVSGMGLNKVLVKPNLNTADPSPGSTHLDTLRAVIGNLRQDRPCQITVADRSGPADTHQVFEQKGIFDLAREMRFETVVLDELPRSEFVKYMPENGHWSNGFYFAKMAQITEVVGLCCLKTHMYGGHFTMSLKLATGLVHRQNMTELHSSLHMREMIAEMNLAYRPRFFIMDGIEAFYDGGPMTGSVWKADLSMASEDRVALDAAGVAALKMHGTTREIDTRKIFEQTQIKHAARLGLGVKRAEDIELKAVDEGSQGVVEKLEKSLYDGS